MTVWLITRKTYQGNWVEGVAATEEAAGRYLKAVHDDPTVYERGSVKWSESRPDKHLQVDAVIPFIPGVSAADECTWEIEPREVQK